jgi:hypothetical protein
LAGSKVIAVFVMKSDGIEEIEIYKDERTLAYDPVEREVLDSGSGFQSFP